MTTIRPGLDTQTESERLFSEFCRHNNLVVDRVPTEVGKTPDFSLRLIDHSIAVEIKQIESLRGFNQSSVSSRTVGSHVRQKISEARKQLQVASRAGQPTILLIYNAADPWQLFGTEPHDFLCAMYGELTVHILDGKAGNPVYGRNARLRPDANTSFGAVGHLTRGADGPRVTIYENVYAANPLPFSVIPSCIDAVRVVVEDAA
ncbi:hypothetical protein [Arenimonas sp.]|uniref:hypothetical protein n=1 Tax=Arenimonas sp. TaxID=1872635 RepID=UPI0025C46C03|nr:hypothetical protein [Arenimonas sp.]